VSSDLKTDLNPFALLAVTTRDDPSRIMEAAEAQSLFHDAEACQQARATLTNPRRRVEAEFGWFPGVAPGMAQKRALRPRDRQARIRALSASVSSA
jgi:hypothetical protein